MRNCFARSCPTLLLEDILVTRKPELIEIMSDGIWLTRPSPMERMVKVLTALATVIPFEYPITIPPTMLIAVIMSPAFASPRMNLLAPSIAP